MSFITWNGSFPSNPLGATDSHIILAHSTLTDSLVLSEFQNADTAYQPGKDDHSRPDGRSFGGALKIKGTDYTPPKRWVLNLLANDAQLALFEAILDAQPAGQSTMVDSWDSSSTTPIDVFVSVAEKYRSRVAPGWHLLQFEVLEEI